MGSENWIDKEWNNKMAKVYQKEALIAQIYKIYPSIDNFINNANENISKARGLGYNYLTSSVEKKENGLAIIFANFLDKSYDYTYKRFAELLFKESGVISVNFVSEKWWRDYFNGSSYIGEETIEMSRVEKTYNYSEIRTSVLFDILAWVCNRNNTFGT